MKWDAAYVAGWVRFLLRRRVPICICLACLVAASAYFYSRVPFNNSIEGIGVIDDPMMADYRRFREVFHGDEEVYLLLESQGGLSRPVYQVLKNMTEDLTAIPGVRRVISLLNTVRVYDKGGLRYLDGVIPRPDLSEDELRQAVRAVQSDPLYQGIVVARDGTGFGMVVFLEPMGTDEARREVVLGQIEHLVARYEKQGTPIALGGIPVIHQEATNLTKRDWNLFGPLTLVIILGMIYGIYRSWASVIVLGTTILPSMLISIGLYSLLGNSFNWVTTLLPTLLLILAVADGVHMYSQYLLERPSQPDTVSALISSFQHTYFPCTLTTLTNMFALMSLGTSHVVIVRQFGLYAALGVVIALVMTFILIPIGISFFPGPSGKTHFNQDAAFVQRFTQRCALMAFSRPALIFTAGLILVALSFYGSRFINSDTDINNYFSSSSPVRRDMLAFDQKMAGSSTIEVILENPSGSVIDRNFLATAGEAEGLLAHSEAALKVKKVLSLLPYLRRTYSLTSPASQGPVGQGQEDREVLPNSAGELQMAYFNFKMTPVGQQLLSDLVSADEHFLRFVVRTEVVGSHVAWEALQRLRSQLDGLYPAAGPYRFYLTGSGPIFTRMTEYLVTSQLRSFFLAFALNLVLMVIYMGSLRLGLISMIPNVIPIALTFGLMGFFKVPLTVGSAMFATVCLGIIVDDTIHFLWSYKQVIKEMPAKEAIVHALHYAGSPIVATAILLVAGFGVLAFSNFVPTSQWGMLIAATIGLALFGDLLLLPASLALFAKTKGAPVLSPAPADEEEITVSLRTA